MQSDRNYLKRKMLETFDEEFSRFSDDFKEILADDMVTALENRMAILMEIQSKELMKKKD